MPFDLVPRLITRRRVATASSAAWSSASARSTSSCTTSTTSSASSAAGSSPRSWCWAPRGYRREFRGVDVPLGVYTHVVGSDLVRDAQRRVLRAGGQPAHAVRRLLPGRESARAEARLAADLPRLRRAPRRGLPAGPAGRAARRSRRRVPTSRRSCCSRPGVYNSAYFEHAFLAKAMGVEMVQGSDLFVDDGHGLHAHDQRPAARRRDLPPRRRRLPRSAGLPPRLPARRPGPDGHLPHGPRQPGQRHRHRRGRRQGDLRLRAARSSATTWARTPILPNVPTYLPDRARRPAPTSWSTSTELVVKSVNESGGYGMLIGPHATQAEREEFRARVVGQPARLHRPADAGALAPSLLGRRPLRGPPRRPAAVRAVRARGARDARRPDPRRACAGARWSSTRRRAAAARTPGCWPTPAAGAQRESDRCSAESPKTCSG